MYFVFSLCFFQNQKYNKKINLLLYNQSQKRKMSYEYYQTLRGIQTEQRLRRSRIQAEITNQRLRRSNINNQIAMKENQFIKKELANSSLGNPFGQTQYQDLVQREANQFMLRRSRMEAEIQTNRLQREAALRRSRLQNDVRVDKTNRNIEKSRLESQLQASRLNSKRMLQDSIRRSKVEANVNSFLSRY